MRRDNSRIPARLPLIAACCLTLWACEPDEPRAGDDMPAQELGPMEPDTLPPGHIPDDAAQDPPMPLPPVEPAPPSEGPPHRPSDRPQDPPMPLPPVEPAPPSEGPPHRPSDRPQYSSTALP